MAKLTASRRKSLPSSAFAGPNRTFPIQDASHARAAVSGASRAFHAGTISRATELRVQAAARRKLGKGK